MATIFKADGTKVKDYNHQGLEAKQKAVGGYIEPVYTSEWVVLVNEDGLFKNLPVNYEASVLTDRTIVGDVLVLTREEWASEN